MWQVSSVLNHFESLTFGQRPHQKQTQPFQTDFSGLFSPAKKEDVLRPGVRFNPLKGLVTADCSHLLVFCGVQTETLRGALPQGGQQLSHLVCISELLTPAEHVAHPSLRLPRGDREMLYLVQPAAQTRTRVLLVAPESKRKPRWSGRKDGARSFSA